MRRNQKGFTLMELMVVIVIVAILAAVAVPLYINYVKDATRTEAKGAIGAVITAEQTYYQLNADGGPATYTTADFVQNPQPGDQSGLNCDLTEALKNWTIRVSAADADGFTVDAIGQNSAAGLEVHFAYSRTGTSTWTEI
jgi:prepilin-type N-terminal cleavage/methylation domain-containing protein